MVAFGNVRGGLPALGRDMPLGTLGTPRLRLAERGGLQGRTSAMRYSSITYYFLPVFQPLKVQVYTVEMHVGTADKHRVLSKIQRPYKQPIFTK